MRGVPPQLALPGKYTPNRVEMFRLLTGGEFDAISAGALRSVERLIGLAQKLREFRATFRLKTGDSKAGCDRRGVSTKSKYERCKLLPEPVNGRKNILFVYMRQDHYEFFAAHSAADVRSARRGAQHFREFLQH